MKVNHVFAAAAFAAMGLTLATNATAGSTIFTDSVFTPADYSTVFTVLSDPSNTIDVSQCAACGDPGDALHIIVAMPTGGGVFNAVNAVGVVNNTFAYDPAAQGAIKSISASTDKDISVNVAQNYGNFFRPMIEQGGKFYEAGITGPLLFGPGTTGFNTLSASGLTAADFFQVDATTGAVGTAHPNFGGGPMLFGLTQFTGADAISGTSVDVVYDNLNITLASVPEPATWAMMLVGFGGLGAAIRSRRTLAATPA
jgi:hypothetical protein